MSTDVAVEFLGNVDKLGAHNVVFENLEALSITELELYHILHEYDMEIPVKDVYMTLFVGAAETCAEDLLDFLRSSVSQQGYVEGVWSTKGMRSRLSSQAVRLRFLSGAAKIISADRFRRLFPCKCAQFHQVEWFCSYGKPDPLMTQFIHDSSRFDPDTGRVVGDRTTVTYFSKLLGLLIGVSEKDLSSGTLKRPLGYNYRSSMSDIQGDRMPPLKRYGRAQHRIDWDTEGLYHSRCA